MDVRKVQDKNARKMEENMVCDDIDFDFKLLPYSRTTYYN